MTRMCLACLLLFTALRTEALPLPVQVAPGHVSAPLQTGVSIGGKADLEFTLIGAETEALKNGERLSLAYGDARGNQQKGETGFFHIAVDRDGRRVVIDLAQIRRTAVDPQKLARILASSKLIESSEMTTDPFDGSTNITLTLRAPVAVRVSTNESGPARLMLDLEPVAKGKRL